MDVLRRRVISLRKKGKKNIEIARMLGLAPPDHFAMVAALPEGGRVFLEGEEGWTPQRKWENPE
jgi:hypothetical protein